MATLDNQWDTDPYGDPTQQGSNPWMTPPAGDPGTGTAATPTPAPTSPIDVTGVTPWSEQNPSTPTLAPQAAPQTSAGAPNAYDAHLSTIASATNPAQQATAQDGLARQVQSDLEADGHTVKWSDPTTLSVDGRPYEIGTSGQGITDPSMASPPPAGGGTAPAGTKPAYNLTKMWQDPVNAPSPGDPYYAVWRDANKGNPLAAAEPVGPQLNANGDGPYTPPSTPNLTAQRPTGGTITDPTYAAQFVAWMATQPGVNPSVKTDPNYWIGRFTSGAFGTDEDYAISRMMQAEGPPEGASGSAGATSPWLGGTPGPKSLSDYPAWSPSAPTYTPNYIDPSASELPGYQDILDTLNTPAPGDAELGQLVQSIVAHPETLSDQDIEMLKAKSAEEAAVAGQSQDEELQHFGYNAGLDSSPWLAGQRAQNAWDRSNTTINANRSIDIAAASQRTADREQAAQIGTAYSSFQSSKKAQAVGLAVNAALGKAGEQRSRTQLNESLKQAATQLGLTKDNLVMTYLGHVMTDLTNNKQLDLNFDIDMKKLAEQSDEFKQTLLQRMAELSQSDNQFKANYQLEAEKFQHQKDQDAWERAKSTVGA